MGQRHNQNSTESNNFSVIAPTEEPVIPPSGGGTITLPTEQFKVDPDVIKSTLVQGETKTKIIRITNYGLKEVEINLEKDDPDNILSYDNSYFKLLPGEVEFISVELSSREKILPGAYISKLIFNKGKSSEKSVLFITEIEMEGGLFDIHLDLENVENIVNAGEELNLNITLTNFGREQVDVTLSTAIKDLDRNTIESFIETVAVFNQKNILQQIPISKATVSGIYLVEVIILYEGEKYAISAELFQVVGGTEKEVAYTGIIPILLIIISLLLIVILLYIIFKNKKYKDKEEYYEKASKRSKMSNYFSNIHKHDNLRASARNKSHFNNKYSKKNKK